MKTILIVDDDERITKMLTRRLKREGYIVEAAINGEVGVDKAEKLQPDLVLLDMHMPMMDGYTAVRKLRKQGYTKPVCALTASAMTSDTTKSLEAGCNYFIAKPIGDDFEDRIKAILDQSSHNDSNTSQKESQTQPCILVIDDDKRTRRMLCSRIREFGYEILAAENGREALEIAGIQRIDLALVDQLMPDLNGLETFEMLRELKGENFPVIMLTAHGSIRLVRTFLKAGGWDFEEKPVDFDLLQIKIRRSIQQARKVMWEIEQRENAEDSLQVAYELLQSKMNDNDKELVETRKRLQGQISARVSAEESLRAKEEMLLQAQKMESIGRLAGGIAHDVNNIVTTIVGCCEFLLQDLKVDDARGTDILEIQKAAGRAAAMTSQLLAFSRKQSLQPQVIDTVVVVHELYGMLKNLMNDNIKIDLRLAETPIFVKVDKSQFEQVVVNLAINARDAMPNGGELTISMRLSQSNQEEAANDAKNTDNPYLILEVRDTGEGMDRETQSQIFEPFFSTKERGKGTGLGLATVYGITQQSGGTISVSSCPGMGTRFSVRLPCVSDAVLHIEPRKQIKTLDGRETILLVEDQEQVRRVTSRMLRAHGYQVLAAESGLQAQQRMKEVDRPVHMMIVDLMLPDICGEELASKMISLQPDLRILFVSGHSHQLSESMFGGNEVSFIQKPYNREVLATRVRELLDQSEEQRTLPH